MRLTQWEKLEYLQSRFWYPKGRNHWRQRMRRRKRRGGPTILWLVLWSTRVRPGFALFRLWIEEHVRCSQEKGSQCPWSLRQSYSVSDPQICAGETLGQGQDQSAKCKHVKQRHTDRKEEDSLRGGRGGAGVHTCASYLHNGQHTSEGVNFSCSYHSLQYQIVSLCFKILIKCITDLHFMWNLYTNNSICCELALQNMLTSEQFIIGKILRQYWLVLGSTGSL